MLQILLKQVLVLNKYFPSRHKDPSGKSVEVQIHR